MKKNTSKTKSTSMGQIMKKKSLEAHQQAPLDYISPWEAHHLHQPNHLNTNESPKIKSKIPQYKQNVVNSFLAKIRKTGHQYKPNQSKKNGQQRQNYATYSNYQTGATVEKNESFQQTIGKTNVQNQKPLQQKLEGAQDVGFGLIKYNKLSQQNNEKQQIQKVYHRHVKHIDKKSKTFYMKKQNKNAFMRGKSYTYNNYTSPDEEFHQNLVMEQEEHLENMYKEKQGTITKDGMIITKKSMRRFLTQERPQELVFIKKKKPNNKVAIVDINETAQQFYDEQMKYIEENLIKKYGKNANSRLNSTYKNRNKRYIEQFQNELIQMANSIDNSIRTKTESHISYKFGTLKDRQCRKKRSTFLNNLRDQELSSKLNNIVRNRPSLAVSLLTSK